MSNSQITEAAFNNPGLRYRNPSIPSTFRIPTELTNGSQILIAGYIIKKASRFAINLQQGDTEYADIFLHLNARFDVEKSGYIFIRNAKFGGSWGVEEKDSPEFPFSESASFIVAINVLNDTFVVEVNGKEFITFNNRSQQLSNITHVMIEGSVFISDLHLPFQDKHQRIDRWLSIPGVNKIGDTLELFATTPLDRNRFAINFINGFFGHDDIAFHFNPRFDSGQIILNSRSRNIWGDELKDKSVNIVDQNNFLILFSFDDNYIKTLINDLQIQPFFNRMDPGLIRYCLIESDIVVENAIYNVLPINKDKYTKVTFIQTGMKSLPFKSAIIPSKIVIVSGKVQLSPKRFYVNLQLSSHDIALHFNPRWNDEKSGGATLLFNTKSGDEWATETREPMILKENTFYDFIFKFVGEKEIEVIINGLGLQRNKVAKINHPFINAEVNYIVINGSFDVKHIALNN